MIEVKGKNDVVIEGVESTVKMKISKSADVEAHIVKVLTENYRFPLNSHIRETCSNHYDSHIENGNPDAPILVNVYKNKTGDFTLETSDSGLGLSKEEFYKFYMQIGESTKRGKANLIGGYGCGAKAILSYTDNYEVICKKNGVKCHFLVFKGEEFPECTLLSEVETEEENGVTVKVNIHYWEYSDLINALQQELCYFPTCVFNICGDSSWNSKQIFENELFKWSELFPNREMHIAFGICHYAIDWKILDIPKITFPIAIKIPIDSGVAVHFNRESLMYSKETKELIKNKIKEIANWFVNKYNSEWKSYFSFKEAFHEIDITSRIVKIADYEFDVVKIEKFADFSCNPLKVEYLKIETPQYYKKKSNLIFNNYNFIGFKDYGNSYSSRIKYYTIFDKIIQRYTPVLVNKMPVGYFKRYLTEKYHNKKIIFIKKREDRKLGKRTNLNAIWDTCYMNVCNLSLHPKNTWRERIQEFQKVEKEYLDLVINETAEYIPEDWLNAEKLKVKQEREYSNINYKTLNKEEGDITISYCEKSEFVNKYKFEKKAFKPSQLHKNNYLTVYFENEESDSFKDRIKKLYRIFNKVNVRFAIIGKRELKKLPNIHNFKTFDQFMSRDSKPFVKIVTAILVNQTLEKHKKLKKNEIVREVLPDISKDILTLENYIDKYYCEISDDELLDSILDFAKENNTYDFDILSLCKSIDKKLEDLEFINYLTIPYRWNTLENQNYKKLIYQILLYKKLYKPEALEHFEIIKKEKPVTDLVAVAEIETEEIEL